MTGRKTIVGKIVIGPDGQRQVRPFSDPAHAVGVRGYQKKVQALIRAAERFKAKENEETAFDLLEAAREL